MCRADIGIVRAGFVHFEHEFAITRLPPCHPRRARNSASTIAVAPQISTARDVKRRGDDVAAPRARASSRTGERGRTGRRRRPRECARPRRRPARATAAPSAAPTIGCSRKPLTGMSSGVSAPRTRTLAGVERDFLVRFAQRRLLDRFRPARRRRRAARPGRRGGRACRRGRSARCARRRRPERRAAGRRRGGCAAGSNPGGQSRRGRGAMQAVCRGRRAAAASSAGAQPVDDGGRKPHPRLPVYWRSLNLEYWTCKRRRLGRSLMCH